jgi:hypothetical protein
MVPFFGRRGVLYGRYVEFASFVNGARRRIERLAAFYCGQDLAFSAFWMVAILLRSMLLSGTAA